MSGNIINIENIQKTKYYINILNKIKHKPIILEYLFSLTETNPYILIDFISTDKILKNSLKKYFDKLKIINNLSPELNLNITKYIMYRNIKYKI